MERHNNTSKIRTPVKVSFDGSDEKGIIDPISFVRTVLKRRIRKFDLTFVEHLFTRAHGAKQDTNLHERAAKTREGRTESYFTFASFYIYLRFSITLIWDPRGQFVIVEIFLFRAFILFGRSPFRLLMSMKTFRRSLG